MNNYTIYFSKKDFIVVKKAEFPCLPLPFCIKYLKNICTHFTMDLLLANNKIKRFPICSNEISNDFYSLYVSNTIKELKYCLEFICNFAIAAAVLFYFYGGKDSVILWQMKSRFSSLFAHSLFCNDINLLSLMAMSVCRWHRSIWFSHRSQKHKYIL